ncbi:MAG: hypothetical protein KAI44_09285 [Methylococcales bacterium]|nr:hypothetical protein [Methylococcales bacterium]
MLTYQLHDMAAVVEVAAAQTEFSQHRVLLLRLRERLELTADKLFTTEINVAANRERQSATE